MATRSPLQSTLCPFFRMQQDAFLALLAQDGFAQTVVVERESNGTLDWHAHPFEAKALVLEGALTIETDSDSRTYAVGDIFHLAKDVRHREWFSAAGVRYLVGRKP
ncbi:cupin [Robbsia sp. KACC 23696]|uniref:cupin domain-containing protein n=1 Tax=Robbsia sp. KACC 23696 TaxID=3149231 RepID=UPI00325B7869